ncbi:hypothetical protein [Novosphingobium sp. B 225]|uniref:hypothetical protein n=1 Tax=Novosphingobium sp. B 225 TaxID=1961849 RepID=UPI001124F13F|nr:hypothetical protein [Novosphingobium sp. B 225]
MPPIPPAVLPRLTAIVLAAIGLAGVPAAAKAGPAAPAAAKADDPTKAAPCIEAPVISMLGPSLKAADLFLACAKLPRQTPYKIAHSRFKRMQLLEQLDKRDLAEAELVLLTTPPLSRFPVFTNAASGSVIVGGEYSIGYTQVDLLGARANFRMAAGDNSAALGFANQAIALAGYDPALLLDAAPAFALRSRLAYAAKDAGLAVKLAIRAYLRGSDDPVVLNLIKSQPQASQDYLKAMRQHLQDQLSSYPVAITAFTRASHKPEETARRTAEAKAAASGLESFERTQLGPL